MSDSLYSQLSQHISSVDSTLVIADENTPESFVAGLPTACAVLTNRKDIANLCEAHDITVYFSDFNFTEIDQCFEQCIYRVSKERPVCHYIFNNIPTVLSENGCCVIAGQKNDGIKGYAKKLEKELEWHGALKKSKDDYMGIYQCLSTGNKLDDKNYNELRAIDKHSLDIETLFSKPGQFGWNKIDKGSTFLFDTLLEHYQEHPTSSLDLGCGYGYLSLRLLTSPIEASLKTHIATDNNAAAIFSCQKNLHHLPTDTSVEIISDDCASSIEKTFNLILCNPPFHSGFDNDRALSQKFIENTHKRLAKDGSAYFVVNAFIPIEKLANPLFSTISTIANNGSFKVILLKR